jgi:hypothetical protein
LSFIENLDGGRADAKRLVQEGGPRAEEVSLHRRRQR